MLNKIKLVIQFGYDNFAPLIVFVVAEHLLGLKPAILLCVIFSIADLALRYFKSLSITSLYLFSTAVGLIFGVIDLNTTNPFIFRYESVATNLLTAGFFGITLFKGKPMIQELAEKFMSAEHASLLHVQQYLRILTMVWTFYFVIKAAIYAVISYRLSIDEALAIRSVFGTASLYVLLIGEKIFRRHLMAGLRYLGLVSTPNLPQ